MRPEPIYIDWTRECIFSTRDIPKPRLASYVAAVSHHEKGNVAELMASNDAINIASLSETIFGVVMDSAPAPFTVVSQ
jgi:hypothetical protein